MGTFAERREFIRGAGITSVGGIASFAGCNDGAPVDGDLQYVPQEPNYQGWFENVSKYRGTVDARGENEYRVEVGVKGANGFYYFDPAAIAVSPGSKVTWAWTGKGGTHNVVSTSGAFTSGQLVDDAGRTY